MGSQSWTQLSMHMHFLQDNMRMMKRKGLRSFQPFFHAVVFAAVYQTLKINHFISFARYNFPTLQNLVLGCREINQID